jgi:hypothetical protein
MISYPRAKLLELCADLGHQPEHVSRILIEPGTITVEYLHPITEDGPSLARHQVVDEES